MSLFELIVILLMTTGNALMASLLGVMWKFHTRLLIVEMRKRERYA